jgi:MarR family transcriptional regulator, transcriptional regulator for hemolysin
MPVTPRRGGGFILLDLHYADQLAGRLLAEELERLGVRPEWAGLLTEIRTVEPVRPTVLAQRTGLAPATLYDYLERLVAEGLVLRRPNPDDGRSFLIEATEEGVERVHAVSEAVRRAHARFADLLEQPVTDVESAVSELRFALEDALNRGTTK